MKKALRIAAFAAALVLALTAGFAIGRMDFGQQTLMGDSAFDQRAQEIRQILEQYFYKGVEAGTLEDGMLHGMADALGDPYTTYYNEEELEQYNEVTSETYGGIGVVISMDAETGYPKASRVYKNSPAEKAGMMAGDIFVAVDGERISSEDTLTDLSNRMRGEIGTQVNVTVQRGGQELEFTITRAQIQAEYVEYRMLDNEVGYILISEFSTKCDEEFEAAVAQLQSQGMKRLVLDVRSNPGGYVEQAVSIADMLLPEGVVVSLRDKDGKTQDYTSDADQLGIPMVVLVNEYSASASEILVGALKDYGVATVVGMKTYGKGIVQMMFPLSAGGALDVTIASYYTPNGTSIHGVGIAPDVEIQLSDDLLSGETALTDATDNQLQRAIEIVKSK